MKIILLALCSVLIACQSLNTDSRDRFEFQQKIRHGVIPLDQMEVKKLNLYPYSQKRIKNGQRLYTDHCLKCHGPKGRGDGQLAKDLSLSPTNLNQAIVGLRDFTFYLKISKMSGNMPGWKTPLSSKELEDIAMYLKLHLK